MISFAVIPFFDTPEEGKSREFTKSAIRAGKIVDGSRGCGKTRGLHEVIHEDLAGNAVVVCVNSREASIYRSWYRETFPDDSVPFFLTAGNPCGLQGLDGAFVDGFSRMSAEAQDTLERQPTPLRGIA